ncbi:MAG: glycosyltransferase family 2 protein [Flavobacterium sp.]|uniref:glycosyltransferase family 2 protein n=1 Tax=Flavobacterium sp. TaxID=239 RepID=UPI0022C0C118|nr:glycosyltransferase family 2 protein [Flavobacterium sp.]MCZ8197316.1 glycosyltransferase family 2 protein [Flavobacterium sp.]
MKTLTIFTPTYNRAYCLHLCYESLLRQTSNDFEWLIVDDGSTDTTKELVQGWINENKIPIRYSYKINQGMHSGHNAAYSQISTELNVCVDSDDYMPDDAVEKIIALWRKYGSDKYAGLIGLDETINKTIIGTKFPDDVKECTYGELKPKYGVVGDKKIIYRTEVVKQLEPYPIFEGEKFVPLYFPIVIDKEYKLLSFNEVFCTVDYQLDGSTLNIYNQYFKNPKGFSFSRKIEMIYLPFTSQKIKSCIHYVATSIMTKNFGFLKESPKKIFTFLAIPFGIAFYIYLLKKKNKTRDITKYVS